jgi:processive 1,2-diacylglycerol beta-glucosyltransferase/1,2-diacylglycerol 3-beta-galactosyltransferase
MRLKEKYIFFYLKTGGGHLTPAKSIAARINKTHSDQISIRLIDGFEKASKLIRLIIEGGYRKTQEKAVWIFEILYGINKLPFFANLSARLVSVFVYPHIKRIIETEAPGKIVIFHFFLIHPVLKVLEKSGKKIPVVLVVTDPYTAHPIWFIRKDLDFIIFSEELKQKLSKEIDRNRLHVYPSIVGEKFDIPYHPHMGMQAKKHLGFQPDKKLVLIIGGSDGMPRGKSILKELIKARLPIQIAIVCGKNNALYHDARSLVRSLPPNTLKVYGFIDNVNELMAAADLVISKCGASTIMEILMFQKIPVVNQYIWEQEKGNVDFIRNRKLGFYEKRIKKLPALVHEIIENQSLLEEVQQNIRNAGIKNGTHGVSKFILKYHHYESSDHF